MARCRMHPAEVFVSYAFCSKAYTVHDQEHTVKCGLGGDDQVYIPFLKNFNDSLILPVLPFSMWFFADGLLGFALQ